MVKRKIIKINEKKCTGCGLCIPNCPEGALQIIDGKVRLISDLFCDGLGACIGHCPEGAITIEERRTEPYDEKKVMRNIAEKGPNVIKAHLEHLMDHHAEAYLKQAIEFLEEKGVNVPIKRHAGSGHHNGGCPGSRVMDFTGKGALGKETGVSSGIPSQLRQWPIQLMLVPPGAPYLKDAELLIAADCVPFAYADFHNVLLKGKALLIGCPKLDDAEYYKTKLKDIIKNNNIRSITCAHMEVPCCFGLQHIIRSAIAESGKSIKFEDVTIRIGGEKVK